MLYDAQTSMPFSSISHCGRCSVKKQNIPFQLRQTASSGPPRGPSIRARRTGCPFSSYSLDAPDDVPVRCTAEDAQGLKFAEALPMQWALHVLAVRQVTASVCIRRPDTPVPPPNLEEAAPTLSSRILHGSFEKARQAGS